MRDGVGITSKRTVAEKVPELMKGTTLQFQEARSQAGLKAGAETEPQSQSQSQSQMSVFSLKRLLSSSQRRPGESGLLAATC